MRSSAAPDRLCGARTRSAHEGAPARRSAHEGAPASSSKHEAARASRSATAFAIVAVLAACSSTEPPRPAGPGAGASPIKLEPQALTSANAASNEVAHAGLAAHDAVQAMELAPGFHIELVAAEPDLHQPVALAIDDRGRLWVAEAFQYPQRAEGDVGHDDIVVFEDKDANGTFETRTVFLAGLNLVSGLEVGYGGAWIGAAPYLYFVPDKDGDLVPDGPTKVMLDGWSYADTHETFNAFQWGPDGWLYGCQGNSSRVGAPGTRDEARTPVDRSVWRYDPRSLRFEVFAWGTSNPWGVDFDARGQCVITACVISHLWHMVQGGRYERRSGQHYDTYAFEEIATIADHRHWLSSDPHGNSLTSNAAGGGHAHCGALMALGSAFPPEWRGCMLMGNLHGNRVIADRLERDKSGLVGRHAGNWLLANDRWFRSIALKEGPDGALYLIDWYDKQACHLESPEAWDRTNGRLYRVAFGSKPPVRVDMAAKSSDELAELLGSESEWTARHALRLLYERGANPKLAATLARRARSEREAGESACAPETARLRSLWALRATCGLDEARGRDLVAANDESIVAWTIQFLAEDCAVEPSTLALLVELARSTRSAVVRLYLASALQRLPVEDRWGLAAALLVHAEDDRDQNLPCVLWYGVEPLMALDPARALELAGSAKFARVARLLVRRAAADPALHTLLVDVIAAPARAPQRDWMIDEFLNGIGDQRNLPMPDGFGALRALLEQNPSAEMHERVARLAALLGDTSAFGELRARLADADAAVDARRAALAALARGYDPELCDVLRRLLDDRDLCSDALRALAACADSRIAKEVLERFPSFDESERRDALNLLSSRRSWASHLVYALGSGQIPRNQVGAFVVRKIESLGDERLAARVREVWGSVRATPEVRRTRIDELKTRLTPEVLAQADLPRGREVFSRTCEQCHTFFGRGGKIAPELTGANRGDLEYLLANIVDPSALVARDYWTTTITLTDGRLVAGIQTGSTPSSITLQAENENVVIALDEIEESRVQDVSLMPEGLLDALPEDHVRDLIAYLQSSTQAPLLATEANAASLFDGRSLAHWLGSLGWSVEDKEIVARLEPSALDLALWSELEVRDFRLSCEVRCASATASAGVVFRSRANGRGPMASYRVDLGPGLWGRISETNGRGLLAEAPIASAPSAENWRKVEIEVRAHRVQVWIDSIPCLDLEDALGATQGPLGFACHATAPAEVRFRNVSLSVLASTETAR